mmetsp:Transcript_27692/g.61080  ORF Transcript_27692/g.61080 Transcript_27692/m.61080 type:complete len:95 (-) Transcript_27692:918-1202(-)
MFCRSITTQLVDVIEQHFGTLYDYEEDTHRLIHDVCLPVIRCNDIGYVDYFKPALKKLSFGKSIEGLNTHGNNSEQQQEDFDFDEESGYICSLK